MAGKTCAVAGCERRGIWAVTEVFPTRAGGIPIEAKICDKCYRKISHVERISIAPAHLGGPNG